MENLEMLDGTELIMEKMVEQQQDRRLTMEYVAAVGQVVEQFKNHPEGIIFDIDDNGAKLRAFFNSPAPSEIEQFNAGKKFDIRFVELYDVIMLSIKIGNLPWMDAPYTPHLSKNLTEFDVLEEGQSLALTIMLIDAVTGEIKHLRHIGLPEKFSRKLLAAVKVQKGKNFDKAEYAKAINRIYSLYSRRQIARMGKANI